MNWGLIPFIIAALVTIGVLVPFGNNETKRPTPYRPFSKSPVTAEPTSNSPSEIPSPSPSFNPTAVPVSVGCNTLYYSNNGVPAEGTFGPTASYPYLEFRTIPDDLLILAVTFQYESGQLKGFTARNFPIYGDVANFTFSTSNAPATSFPVSIPITAPEQETPFFNPNDCSPLPCTQNIYVSGVLAYCATPIPTLSPGPAPVPE